MRPYPPGLRVSAAITGPTPTWRVVHTPTGAPASIILEVRHRHDAMDVVRHLAQSGVDWTQPHTRETHPVMRAAIIAATAGGTVYTATFAPQERN